MCVQIAHSYPNGEVARMPGPTAHFTEKMSKGVGIWGLRGKDGHRSPSPLRGSEISSLHPLRKQPCPVSAHAGVHVSLSNTSRVSRVLRVHHRSPSSSLDYINIHPTRQPC